MSELRPQNDGAPMARIPIRRVLSIAWVCARMAVWFPLDVTLKLAVGVIVVLTIWLPFHFFMGTPVKWWLIVGAGLGTLLNGFWELCDVFGLKKLLRIRGEDID